MHCASVETISEYIGPTATARLIEFAGGTMLKVPKKQSGKTWERLAEALGSESAGVLCDYFGGESLYIALNHSDAVRKRREEVQRRVASGETFREIAKSMTVTIRYTERGVRRMAHGTASASKAKELPAPHPLMSLFG